MLKLALGLFVFAVFSMMAGIASDSQMPLDVGRVLILLSVLTTATALTANIINEPSIKSFFYTKQY